MYLFASMFSFKSFLVIDVMMSKTTLTRAEGAFNVLILI